MNRNLNQTLITFISVVLLALCLSLSVTAANITVGNISKLKSTVTPTTVTLEWKKAKNAKGYQVSLKKGEKWEEVATVSSTTCKINGLKAGAKYTYRVRAFRSSNYRKTWAKKSKKITVITSPKKVSGLEGNVSGKTATLKWNKTKGATGYIVFQYNSATKNWTEIKNTKALKVKIKNLEAGKIYKFAVKAYSKKDNKTVLSNVYSKVTLTVQANAEPVELIVNSYGYGDGVIYLEVDPSNWEGKFKAASQNIILKVNGEPLEKTATCTVPSKKTGSVYEIKISVPTQYVNHGYVISFTIPAGIVKNEAGTQYNLSYHSSVTV